MLHQFGWQMTTRSAAASSARCCATSASPPHTGSKPSAYRSWCATSTPISRSVSSARSAIAWLKLLGLGCPTTDSANTSSPHARDARAPS